MKRQEWLAGEFERNRSHLRAVAYRMLGSVSEAEDAVQEAWVRLDRADPGGSDDLRGWLTVVVGRICLDMLRARRARRETFTGDWFPEPILGSERDDSPEHAAVMADSVGLALLVVLEQLNPAERLAFVLHDVFGVPFEEIAEVVERSPAAARQLASRARRRVRESAPRPDADLALQRRVVDAFLAAARSGDFEALLQVLDPQVVARSHIAGRGGRPRRPIVGATADARQVQSGAPRFVQLAEPAIVNGAAGLVLRHRGRTIGVVGFTVVERRIAAIDLIADPEEIRKLAGTPGFLPGTR